MEAASRLRGRVRSIASRRRSLRARDTAYATVLVTLVTVLLAYLGALNVPERWMYDLRTEFCQFGRPAPTDQLVHLDLDERSLKTIGYWPWPRAQQAEIFDELARAKPRAVAIDVLYSEPGPPTIFKTTDETGAVTGVSEVDNDALLEAALRRLPGSIVGYEHATTRRRRASVSDASDTEYGRLLQLVERRPTIDESEALAGVPRERLAETTGKFIRAREEAIERLVERLMREREHTADEILTAIGAKSSSDDAMRDAGSPAIRIALSAHAYEAARRRVDRHSIVAPPAALASLYTRDPGILPLARFADAASSTAFYTYIKGGDGFIRRVPAVINEGGRASMGLGVVLALRALDVKPESVRLEPDTLIIPYAGREIRVPLGRHRFDDDTGDVGGILTLPWFGESGKTTWETMYEPPLPPGTERGLPRFTVSIDEVYQAVLLRKRIEANNAELRRACLVIGSKTLGKADLDALTAYTPDPSDPAAWASRARALLEPIADELKLLDASPPRNPGPEVRGFAAEQWRRDHEDFLFHRAALAVREVLPQLDRLGADLAAKRRDLTARLGNKAVLVGWTATGRTDFVTTPLHPACPGVRVHGVVFNAIVTGNFITFPPIWQDLAITLAFGLLVAGAVVRFTPGAAQLVAFALAVAYTAANGTVFGYGGQVFALAAPLTAIAATWSVGSVVRFVVERADRKRVIDRFSRYADPQLVNYFQRNPDKETADGEQREMTVCFTDLAGFTTLSERLGEQTVGILNRYFAFMVPVIRRYRGHLNKLLGDGMMFFFNGLEANPRHTADAFECVLAMQAAVTDFNRTLEAEGLPTVKMRVGITRGPMIAGDAGGKDFSDYTVLGDAVNLASRLEGANKASGTLIICNREARDAAGDAFLTRPVGTLQVVGKTEGVEAFELMCRRADANPDLLALAALTGQMVDAYRRGDLDACCNTATEIEDRFGPHKLPELYRRECDALRTGGIPEGFAGTIVLESK